MKYLIILFLFASCGKIKVETNVPDNIKFGADFQHASDFCDSRYGVGTIQSEECFMDYRTYLSPKVTLDLASIDSFCKASYSSLDDIKGCQQDILAIIKGSIK